MNYKPSKPFSNGSEFYFFNDNFCCRCNRYKLNADGMPLPDNCEIDEALNQAMFDDTKWPENDIVETVNGVRVCLKFESDDAKLMEQYRALFDAEEGAE